MTNREAICYVIMKAFQMGKITQAQAESALTEIEAGTFVPSAHPVAVQQLRAFAKELAVAAGPTTQFTAISNQNTPV